MKLAIILAAILISGCNDGYTENRDISLIPGFEGCIAASSFWDSTTVVRCPNSTTSTKQGKNNKTIVVDGN